MDEYILPGNEDMEISTQIILREAAARGIQFEILDRPENFIELIKNGKSEFIKEASKTRLDSYMTYLVMENKIVSKKVLSTAGLRVPIGDSYSSVNSAKSDYTKFKNIKKVIKPVTTNFGIGIFISEPNESEEEYLDKVKAALEFSPSVIVEEFLNGPEYRFLVLGYKVAAVCNRIPANVVGDNLHTVSELVDIKNQDPRRGVGHKTPLEKIQKSNIETEILKVNGLNWDYIPKQGEIVYLRKNSNISTGGDSIDVTDLVHPDYFKIAENAARAVESQICGVDIISESIESLPSSENYGILEINFNPVLYIHDFPYEGKNRKVGAKVLDLLGF
ncbi:bifunctional glutamate--cysteine ligase GshA/glutathione synthetase GshB [Leptospira sp. GIMC2001]|uniref:bifunctional glutamate--cysteine ligase GshA/glutathione synthetase GshB n=1 Tax=Leptospira sp. GIMC2001 TaxID=1513297 RepID=UPI00234B64B0|nr:bifunctional glutamate--cysteine ligase GshA/glutathione synthetase GshB [Leptospira sp. GIMC2001]WCL51137.1 bifunctional glutamate--cysteine ligase GshA/glutathione synthetase GshB [Leptospira sp. GIMC2001]